MIYHYLKQPRPDLVKNRHHQIRWKCGDRVSDSGFEKGKKSFKWMIVPILHDRGFRTKMIAWNDVASSISRIHHANCKPSTISSMRQLALNSPWIIHEFSQFLVPTCSNSARSATCSRPPSRTPWRSGVTPCAWRRGWSRWSSPRDETRGGADRVGQQETMERSTTS